jgi:hypothetical protein
MTHKVLASGYGMHVQVGLSRGPRWGFGQESHIVVWHAATPNPRHKESMFRPLDMSGVPSSAFGTGMVIEGRTGALMLCTATRVL